MCPYSVPCISTWAFERTHFISPKFKIANSRHIPNRIFSFPYCIWDLTSVGFRIVFSAIFYTVYIGPNRDLDSWAFFFSFSFGVAHAPFALGWSENGRKFFFKEFQLTRYVQRCQYIKRTLCKKLKDFKQFF